MKSLPFLALLVLTATLAVYPTPLNPGLPLILGGGFCVLVAIARFWRGSGKYYGWIQDALAVLGVVLAVSLAWNRFDLYLGAKSLFTFWSGLAFVSACQVGVREGRDARRVAYAYVGLVGIFCLWAWLEAFPEAHRSGGFEALKGRFVNPDSFSVLPLSALMLGFGLVERLSKRWVMPFCGVLAFLLISLLATGCRAAILGGVVGSGIFLVLATRHGKQEFDQSKFLVVVPLLVALLILPVSAFNFASMEKILGTLTGSKVTSEETRLEVNVYGWKAVAQRPLIGSGPGSFGSAYQSVRPPGHDELYIDIAHNDYVEMAVEGGALGLGLWLLALGLTWRKCFRCARSGTRPFFAAGLVGALSALMVFSFFNFVLAERPALWAFFFLLGLGASFPSSRFRTKEPTLLKWVSSCVVMAAGLCCVYFGLSTLSADNSVAQARREARELQKEAALGFYSRAFQVQPYRSALWYEAAEEARALFAATGEESWLKLSEDYLRKAIEVSPKDYSLRVRLSEFCQEDGRFQEATELLESAEKLDPNRLSLKVKRVSLLIRQARFSEAAVALAPLVRAVKSREFVQWSALVLTAGRKDEQGLAELLSRLEQISSPEVFSSLVEGLLKTLLKEERWAGSQVVLEKANALDGDEVCLALAEARLVSVESGTSKEFEVLKKMLPKALATQGTCGEELISRYAELLEKLEGRPALLSFLEERVKSEPSNGFLAMRLAAVYEEKQEWGEAERVLRAYLDRGMPDVEANLALARVYEGKGVPYLATSYYRDVLRLEPKNSVAQRALQKLSKKKVK